VEGEERERVKGEEEERDETVCRVVWGCDGGLTGPCGSVVCVDGF